MSGLKPEYGALAGGAPADESDPREAKDRVPDCATTSRKGVIAKRRELRKAARYSSTNGECWTVELKSVPIRTNGSTLKWQNILRPSIITPRPVTITPLRITTTRPIIITCAASTSRRSIMQRPPRNIASSRTSIPRRPTRILTSNERTRRGDGSPVSTSFRAQGHSCLGPSAAQRGYALPSRR
jgi:hypothetical protein